jgi:predicted ATPase/class 3 adenylate cyclase
MRRDLPSGTVTFLFTDIEGSTKLLHELGPEGYAAALTEHRRVLREAFTRHGGVEVDTQGDALFVAFATPSAAANAAQAARSGLAAGRVRVRMGLHTGTPTVTAEGYVGADVHRGARVAALAHGDQILVSSATAALLDGEVLVDLGTHRLKDFEGATRLYQLGPGEFPPLRTPGSVELPTPATRFLGRERELFDAVSVVYGHDPRVLTIVGPGGTGKTRFAIELARLLAEEADGGTVFVPLAPVRDASLILPATAQVLGAAEPTSEAIASALEGRRTHVVLDNLEHLRSDGARAVADLAKAVPHLRLLVTSREALRIQGEHEFDLPPLEEGEAVELFLTRARAVRPDIERSSAVTVICARLDRLPLAIEVAAARTKLLAPDALLERLGRRLDLLKGTRDADERHATLRTTIAWSYDLLDEEERTLFARLSVFAAGSTLESAEDVCDADLDRLESLLDKSLLRRRTGRLGEERVWMLETIREFAAERLARSPDADTTRRRHAERMLAIARSAHLTEEDDEPFQLPVVLAERDDMRAALDWASDNDLELALELLVALENFWNSHAPEEVLSRLEKLLPRADDIPRALRAGALRLRGGALHVLSDFESCDPAYEESLALYRELGDERGVASLLQRLGNSAFQRRELERARRRLEESQELARGRFPFIEVPNDTVLARVQVLAGDVAGGTELLRRSAEMAAAVRMDWWRAGQLCHLALLALDRGDLDEAERDGHEALRIVRQDESRPDTYLPLTALARVALAREEPRRAGRLWGAVEAEDERAPSASWQHWRAERAGPLLHAGDPEFVAGVDEGRQLDVWDAVAIALGEKEPQALPDEAGRA